LGCHEDELSLLIVDDPQIADLNQEYLSREGPTNVIAFPMQDYTDGDIHTCEPDIPRLLGDVVISVETAQKEGEAEGLTMEERFIQLMIHGILHLLGYDHETSEADALRMEEKSNELSELLAKNHELHEK
jgi:probable rRNA maturation factor